MKAQLLELFNEINSSKTYVYKSVALKFVWIPPGEHQVKSKMGNACPNNQIDTHKN